MSRERCAQDHLPFVVAHHGQEVLPVGGRREALRDLGHDAHEPVARLRLVGEVESDRVAHEARAVVQIDEIARHLVRVAECVGFCPTTV